ncbi:MAG: N-acetyl-gamma-glutamyl-phosphate reductase [Myxococcales bacterium]|nr:N-acetyl-gamma-glutamyl-phosphate reductase [Myxococcales bacterium]
MSSSARVPVGVVGASGFLGAEVVRLLAQHPRVELAALCAASSAGRLIGEVRPSLAALGDRRLEPVDAEALARRCELVFLALPHGESAELARALGGRTRVIDLGSDFRLRDARGYPRYYGREHPHPELLERAQYVLPELTPAAADGVDIIANPGCFATALALGLAPLCPALDAKARVAASGVTGSSGSGAAPSSRVHHSLRHNNLCTYKPLEHQHLGELYQLLEQRGARRAVDFVPHSGPFVRGIHLTLVARDDELGAHAGGAARALYEAAYADAPLVRLLPAGETVQLGAVIGSCRADIAVTSRDGATVVTVAIDNLLKGGSGQAVHNMNLWLGFDALEAVPRLGVWP